MLGQNKIRRCWFYWRTWRRMWASPQCGVSRAGRSGRPASPWHRTRFLASFCASVSSVLLRQFQPVFSFNLPGSDASHRAQIRLYHVLLSRRGRSVKANFAAVCSEPHLCVPRQLRAAPGGCGTACAATRRRRRNGGRKARRGHREVQGWRGARASGRGRQPGNGRPGVFCA